MDNKIKAAVIGVGFFGERHARVYSELPNVELVAVVDSDIKRAREIGARYGCEATSDITSLFGKINAASIATPTGDHVKMAIPLLSAGVDLLIEKPITATVSEAEEIILLAQQKGRVVQVGHIERYNPALLQLREYPLAPRIIECHRMGPFVERAANVSVVLDLMIHDIDIVLSLSASEIVNVEAMGLSVMSSEIDIAHARLHFSDGLVASLCASRISEEKVRTLKIFQDQGYFFLNYATRELVATAPPRGAGGGPRTHAAEGLQPLSRPSTQRYSFEQGDALRMEIGSFLEAATSPTRATSDPTIIGASAAHAKAALAVALRMIEAIRAH